MKLFHVHNYITVLACLMVMTYASPLAVHEPISTDSVKEKVVSGDLHLIDDHKSEELDRTSRDGAWYHVYCMNCRCCKNG